jgi:hypothetical protein
VPISYRRALHVSLLLVNHNRPSTSQLQKGATERSSPLQCINVYTICRILWCRLQIKYDYKSNWLNLHLSYWCHLDTDRAESTMPVLLLTEPLLSKRSLELFLSQLFLSNGPIWEHSKMAATCFQCVEKLRYLCWRDQHWRKFSNILNWWILATIHILRCAVWKLQYRNVWNYSHTSCNRLHFSWRMASSGMLSRVALVRTDV